MSLDRAGCRKRHSTRNCLVAQPCLPVSRVVELMKAEVKSISGGQRERKGERERERERERVRLTWAEGTAQ